MREREDIAVAVVSAAPDARLTSRLRLQKSVYLLDRLGFGSGFAFDYHHYGPYSRELDKAAGDATALAFIDERILHRVRDGASYSVFEAKVEAKPEIYAALGRERVGELLSQFAKTNVTVLELAATIHWLWDAEEIVDWRSEVKERKGPKTEGGRLEKAIELLVGLGLNPPEPHASNRV